MTPCVTIIRMDQAAGWSARQGSPRDYAGHIQIEGLASENDQSRPYTLIS